MLQQIMMHTPLWVWAVLAILLYRGLLATVEREIALKRIFIIPFVMLALSLQGIASAFGTEPVAAPAWLAGMLAGMLAGSTLAWQIFDRDSVRIDVARRMVSERGSWSPLLLMMSVFCTKYAVGIALTMQPVLAQQDSFVAAICALYGVFNGVFFSKALRVLALYRQAGMSARTIANPMQP